ncbi:MAG: permease [Blastocatellales bacterium]
MLTIKGWLLVALGVFTIFYLAVWVADLLRRSESVRPKFSFGLIGFGTNFFDALGIGSFATTTSIFKFWKMTDDRTIPGTLNVGHTLPTIAQAFISILIIEVEMKTLLLLILSSVAGAWLGAGVVAGWSRRKVQIGMGLALLAAAVLMLVRLLRFVPGGTPVLGLEGPLLWIGMAGNFMLGALMTLGIGLYAPCLIMIGLLGMTEKTAFPIMMGSCAFLMPVSSARFVRKSSYDPKATIGLALGGIPAVLIALLLVKSLPLDYVKGLVIVVVVYTAAMMLRSAIIERRRTDQGSE